MTEIELKIKKKLSLYEDDKDTIKAVFVILKTGYDYNQHLSSLYSYLKDSRTNKSRDSILRFIYKEIGREITETND